MRHEEEKKAVDPSQFGWYNDDMVFFLKKGAHLKVFTYFKDLYINRVQYTGSIKKFSKSYEKSVLEHGSPQPKPHISEKSA